MKRILVDIPPELRWDAAAIKEFRENAPYYLADARISAIDGRKVAFEAPDDSIDEHVRTQSELLARTIATNLRDALETVLFEHSTPSTAHPDPMLALRSSGAAVQTGRGRFVYGGVLLQLLDALDALLSEYALGAGSEAQAYPSTVGASTLIRSGYLKAFPQHAFFVAPAARSPTSLHEIGRCTEAADLDAPHRGAPIFGPHDQVLAPTVCYHCMEALQGRTLDAPRCFTAANHCHRSEVLAEASLERLECFRMRELVAFGDEAFVRGILDGSLEWTAKLLQRWGIAHSAVTATDPFFAGAAGSKLFFQSTFALKREMRIRLDFSGRWLSVASFNHHQQSLTRAFGINGPSGPAVSGCTGWGHERLSYALMSQLGTNLSRWPQAARADLRL
jgi:hypothetical protein